MFLSETQFLIEAALQPKISQSQQLVREIQRRDVTEFLRERWKFVCRLIHESYLKVQNFAAKFVRLPPHV